jgi:restriction system protein
MILTKNNSIQNEDLLMPLVIKLLQDNGGELTKEEIAKLLSEQYREWNDYINTVNVSKNNGREWKPWYFTINFTLKHLKLAGFLTTPRKQPVKLTESGMSVDVDKVESKSIRSKSQPIWDNEKELKHIEKKIVDDAGAQEQEEELSVDVEDDLRDNEWRRELLNKLKTMNPYKFEQFCRGLLKKMGIQIDSEKGIKKSNDGGIDGFGYYVGDDFRTVKVALQCKRFNEGIVGSHSVDALMGSVAKNAAEYGIFITTSIFSKSAIDAAKSGNISVTLIDGNKLIDLIDKYEYRVRKVYYCIPNDSIWEE